MLPFARLSIIIEAPGITGRLSEYKALPQEKGGGLHMKLAFSTLGCPDWTFDQILDSAQQMGFQGIELRGVQGELRADRLRPLLPENRLESLRKLREHGLKQCGFGASACFQEGGMEAGLADGRAAIALCAAAGIPYVRVFGGKPARGNALREQVRCVTEGINALCAKAKQTGVSILLEAHGWYQTAQRLLAVAEGVEHANFGVLWDVEHSNEADGGDFLSFYMPVKELIRHVHLKDHKKAPGRRVPPVQRGRGRHSAARDCGATGGGRLRRVLFA